MPANDGRHGPKSRRTLIKTISIAAAAIIVLTLGACSSTTTTSATSTAASAGPSGGPGTLTGGGFDVRRPVLRPGLRPIPPAADDDRDGGNLPGRLARHRQHGVVLAAARPAGTSGELLGWAELPCPLKAAMVSAVAPGPGLARRRRARSAVTMR